MPVPVTRELIDNDTILDGYSPVFMVVCFLLLFPIYISVVKIRKHYHDEARARAMMNQVSNRRGSRNNNDNEDEDSSDSSSDWERDWQDDQNNPELARQRARV